MRDYKKKFVISLFWVLFFPSYSFAYFDPGTAAFIIQSLIALIGSVFVFLANPLKFLKSFISKLKKKKKEDDKTKYSE